MHAPYYQDNRCTLYHADCREIYPQLDPAALVVTDPPYGQTSHVWDRWQKGWLELLIDTPQFWCWGSFRMFWDHADEFAPFHFSQDAVWEKQNGSSMAADRFKRVHEHVALFHPKRKKWADLYHDPVRIHGGDHKSIVRKQNPPHWNRIGTSHYHSKDGGVRLVRSVMRAKNSHLAGFGTTGKPVSILRDLIQYSCPPDGTVVDLFAGSGSTLVAAREVGRTSIGIEASEREIEKAAKRLAQQQLSLRS